MADNRCTQSGNIDPNRNPQLFRQSKAQAQLALERYHYLCAAVKENYELTTVAPDFSQGQIFPRAGLVFDGYSPYALEPVLGVKLHPRNDGTIHPGDIKNYKQSMRNNWKCAQGGILYCIGCSRDFWNMVLNYHSSSATSGIKAWDRLFATLRSSDYDKGVVACMFYGTPAGCLARDCPFLHDKEACTRERERILARRRVKLGQPVMRDVAARERIAIRAHHATQRQVVPHTDSSLALSRVTSDDDEEDDEEEDVDPEIRKIFTESANIKKICNNPDCLNVKMKRGTGSEEGVKMLKCSRCSIATYCSKDCQVADWQKHKKQPCRPFEEIVHDDDLWTDSGDLKGTGRFTINGE